MQKIIVDGYNVIHCDPALRQAAKQGMEKARAGLIERVSRYVGEKHVRVTIVFDGAGVITDVESPVPGRLQILFSASGQTADELIVTTLHAHANPREWIVVTSDVADIGRSVAAAGAQVMSSPSFLERIDAGDAREPGNERPDAEETPGDVDYWLDRFTRRDESDRKKD